MIWCWSKLSRFLLHSQDIYRQPELWEPLEFNDQAIWEPVRRYPGGSDAWAKGALGRDEAPFPGEIPAEEATPQQSQDSPRQGRVRHLPNTVSVSRRFFPSLSHKRRPRFRGLGSSELRWLSCIRTSTCLGILLALEQKQRQWLQTLGAFLK